MRLPVKMKGGGGASGIGGDGVRTKSLRNVFDGVLLCQETHEIFPASPALDRPTAPDPTQCRTREDSAVRAPPHRRSQCHRSVRTSGLLGISANKQCTRCSRKLPKELQSRLPSISGGAWSIRVKGFPVGVRTTMPVAMMCQTMRTRQWEPLEITPTFKLDVRARASLDLAQHPKLTTGSIRLPGCLASTSSASLTSGGVIIRINIPSNIPSCLRRYQRP